MTFGAQVWRAIRGCDSQEGNALASQHVVYEEIGSRGVVVAGDEP